MSHSGVSDTYPYVNSAQRNFHFYARTTAGDSDNEQGYSGTPPFSNESNLEDDSEGGMEGATDSEEEIEEREYNYHNHVTSFTTTEDEDDDDEMDVCSSETESEDNEEEEQQIINNSNIQTFENVNNFNINRNSNGSPNSNNNNNSNFLPPIQLVPSNPSIPTSSLSTSNISNRSIGSDPSLPFLNRYLPIHPSRNGSSPTRTYDANTNNRLNISSFPDHFSSPPSSQSIFRFPNVNHPSPIYPNSTDATVASSSISSASSASSSASNQRKQSPLRFGFPKESQEIGDDDDDDGTSSSTSYDTTSSRKRARSISNDWSSVSQPNFSQSIQFGSLEPVIRDISSRPNQNLRSTQLSSSPPQPSNNRSAGNMTSFIGFSPENDHTPISSPPNILGHYSSNRTRAFSNSRSSSAIVATPSNEPTYPRLQSQSQPPPFFYHRTFAPSRRNFNHSVPQPVEPRRPTSTSNHNGEEQQGYSINFAPASPDITFMYPEVIQQSERRPHHHSNNISGLSQASRASPTSSSTTSRWTSRDPRGRAEILTRPIMPNPNFNRRKVARILGSDEEQDNLTELPESSDSEVNVTTSAPAVRAQFRPPRRHEPRQDNNTIDPTRSRTLAALAAATAVRANSTNDGSLSADEQIARRMQAYEYSSIQNTIDEQNVLARFLGASRARSTTNRRETTSGSSSSSRNESSRRNISTRGTARLPEILSHERHHHEERGNEPRSRGHSRGSQSRNGGRSSSASNYLHHHFIPHYPLLGNLIDSGEIELEDFLDLWPVWGNGIAANPDNYLDEDEFDSSYEGLLRLCERIGDAKPKGVSEDVIKTLPAKTFIAGKSKTAEERCTICLTGYESNDMLRDLPCSHDFHQDCIDSWFKNSDKCPICRRSIVEK